MADSDNTVSKSGAQTPSVALLLDGHDSAQAARAIEEAVSRGIRAVVVSLDTPKTVLLPAELAEEGVGEAYLRFCGMEPSKGGRAVVSGEDAGIVALMAVDGAILDLLEKSFESVAYTSPLLDTASGKKYVRLFLTRSNAYLTVWDRELKFAEVLPDPSADSALYFLQALGREFRLRKFDIHIGGEGASEVAAVVSEYFKRVKQF